MDGCRRQSGEDHQKAGAGGLKVLHVIPGLSRSSGGPARSVQGLVAALPKPSVDAWIYPFDNADPWIPGVRKLTQTLTVQTLKHFDLVHIHGIWDLRLHVVAKMCRKAGVPYVIAPRGMLEPWSLKQKWLKKRIARFLYQDKDLKCAAALHATAESEAAQFRKLGFKNPIIISPNGVNVPDKPLGTKHQALGTDEKRRALFVSRMHPKKGVLELVESWARVKPDGWQCELVYTLNGDEEQAYAQCVKDRILALGMSYQDKDGTVHSPTPTTFSNFILIGPLDDEKKWEAYARADLFVLPTYSENFGIVVAEALWAGVPVITTKGTPWKDLVDHKCGWWIELPDVNSRGECGDMLWPALDSALSEAFKMGQSGVLQEKGRNGRMLVESKYTWSAVVKPMVHGYEQALNTCEFAPCDSCRNYGDTCPIR